MTDHFIEQWKASRISEGERLGKRPCLNLAHLHVKAHPELYYSSPHLYVDFGNCDGWQVDPA